MTTMRFPPSPGDRFILRSDAAVSTALTLERVTMPEGMNEDRYFVFRESVSTQTFRYAVSTLAGMLVRKTLIWADPQVRGLESEKRKNPVVDWGQLTREQCAIVKRRLAYVHGVSVHAHGLSFKSRDYREMVYAVAAKRGESPPHPTSVYRWSLRWRRSGNNVAVLAGEVACNRHRSQRKSLENRLALAFLQAKLTHVERTPLSELHTQFESMLTETSLDNLDAQVDALMEEAADNVQAQRKRARERAKARRNKKSRK